MSQLRPWAPTGLRARLRAETLDCHVRVDALFGVLHLAESRGYGHFLRANWLAYTALQKTPILDSRLRVQLSRTEESLHQDLVSMRCHSCIKDHASQLPPLHDLGIGYVVGGSHFGKEFLRQRWLRSADPAILSAGCYFASVECKEIWRRTIIRFSDFEGDKNEELAIIGTAKTVFELFAKSFELGQNGSA